MTTLTYRGQPYLQEKQVLTKQLVQLTYRRNIYTTRQAKLAANHPLLTYRGVQYQK